MFALLLLGTISVSLVAPPQTPGVIGPYLDGIFTETPPGSSSSWELEDPMPGITFQSPLRIIDFPGSQDILLLTKKGEVWRVSLENQTKTLILDIKDRVFKLGDAGSVGVG